MGVVAIPLVPVIVRESFESEDPGQYDGEKVNWMHSDEHGPFPIDEELYWRYGQKSPTEVLAIWRDTGNLIFQS